jgi:hypothetical protein
MAADGRDFTGTFETFDEVESGEDVILTFETEIRNQSDAEVFGATVRLENPDDFENALATWPAVEIARDESTSLTLEVTVPMRERDAWRTGAMPVLTVEYQDVDGVVYRRLVELGPGPVDAEEAQP